MLALVVPVTRCHGGALASFLLANGGALSDSETESGDDDVLCVDASKGLHPRNPSLSPRLSPA